MIARGIHLFSVFAAFLQAITQDRAAEGGIGFVQKFATYVKIVWIIP